MWRKPCEDLRELEAMEALLFLGEAMLLLTERAVLECLKPALIMSSPTEVERLPIIFLSSEDPMVSTLYLLPLIVTTLRL